ncbi:MAG: flagellar basal body L-ring protein FlgH [Candidatus Hydrogenedentes bacterium]|nr:flagellar basal body L-ring protein FlgH [Candidatus Hydrogenedentota bacterium]
MRYVGLIAALLVAFGASADSLFNKGASDNGTLISDKRVRYKVGEIITVLVKEAIDAQTDADTQTKKETGLQTTAPIGANGFLTAQNGLNIIKPEELPNWQILDNGNVEIQGTKKVTVNSEDSTLFVKGVVRPRDVTSQNTVLSSQVADAVIELKGKGPLWNNQRRGWLTKLVDWFSPF